MTGSIEKYGSDARTHRWYSPPAAGQRLEAVIT
jgi:hypothetical protein